MHRQILLLEAVLTFLDFHEEQQKKKCTDSDTPCFTMDADDFADDADLSRELLQLDEIFTRLMIKSNARRNAAAAAAATSTSESPSSQIKVPFGWEAEPGKPKKTSTTRTNHQEQSLCPPPIRLYVRSGSTGSSSSRRSSFSGVFKSLIHGKLPSSDSFRFPGPFSPSSSTKSSKIHHHDEPGDDQICDINNDPQSRHLLSPNAVLDGPDSCSSECTTSNVTPCNNMPFPASFLLPSHTRSFSSLSLSNAIPDSPQADAVSPLSFDTRGTGEIQKPGRYSYDNEVTKTMDEYDISPGWSHGSQVQRKTAIRSKSSGSTMAARAFNQDTLFPSRSLSKFYKFSSNSNVRASTSSSEFSIELNGRLSSGRNLTSSRYLELDFKEAWNANIRAAEIFNSNSNNNIRNHGNNNLSNNEPVYDVKSDIRNRVEEVVRNTDENTFTFSPVASSFLFSKSQSSHKQVCIQNTDSGSDYIEIQPDDDDNDTKDDKDVTKDKQRVKWWWCCIRG